MRKICLLLIVVALISYGQMVKMNFWQDDNAVVFKFTHINENAGYLGKGIFGEGAYRYTITPYLPIFYLFGFSPVPYFTFALFFYLLSVIAVYLLFKTILESNIKALIAGLLYACGYIASDGFIRMFNSVLTSLSVIFTAAAVSFYFQYYKTKKAYWYLFSLIGYLLAIEIGFVRTHFFIFVIVAFELIFFSFVKTISWKKTIRNLFFSILRITPFLLLFYQWFIVGADKRSGLALVLIKSLIKGEFYNLYSFFASLGNIFLSNEIFPNVISYFQDLLHIGLTDSRIIILFSAAFFIFLVLLKKYHMLSLKLSIIFFFSASIVLYLSKIIFSHPGLIGGINEKASLYSGIFFIILCLLLLKILPFKKTSLLLIIWALINLAAYGAYIPIYAYPSDNRYLLQSFIPLTGLLALWAIELNKKLKTSPIAFLPIALILAWGGINLYSSLSLQQKILAHRSEPSKRFFQELKEYVPSFTKGSVFYFFIPDKPFAKTHYDNGFSVAQMPEETAIAWRYGLDRYDFAIVNNFQDFKEKIDKDNVPLDKVYSFIAEPDRLINVTSKTRAILKEGQVTIKTVNLESEIIVNKDTNTTYSMKPLKIIPDNISTLTPLAIKFNIKGDFLPASKINFPANQSNVKKSITNPKVREHYLNYEKWRDYYYQNISLSASTSWKKFLPDLLIDQDTETYWEADRVAWDDHNQSITIDLKKEVDTSALIYYNGPSSLIPLEMEVYLSIDNQNFTKVKDYIVDPTKQNKMQKIIFNHQTARYIKLVFHKTIYDDSPGISEIEVLPNEFVDIEPELAEPFFNNPFAEIDSAQTWNYLFEVFQNKGLIKIEWKTDGSDNIMTSVRATLPLSYNGNFHTLNLEIPAGGQTLEYLLITPLTIPGTITVSEIDYQNKPLNTNAE